MADRENRHGVSTAGIADNISRTVEALSAPIELYGEPAETRRNVLLPSRHKIIGCVDDLRSVLFPGYFGYRDFSGTTVRHHVGATLDRVAKVLTEEISHAVRYVEGYSYEHDYTCAAEIPGIIAAFIDCLPEVRRKLVLDAKMCFEWDPAAFIPEAPVFVYPNMLAMMNYRMAHELYIHGVPFIPRIISEHAHSITGIDIHPGADIGESFFIDHGTGVVIGQTAEVGNRVRLFHGVTLGTISFPIDERTGRPFKGQPRHPIVEDDVVIYAEATVLGRITVGAGSIIGANVFLAKSVPPMSKVFAAPVRVGQLKNKEREEGISSE